MSVFFQAGRLKYLVYPTATFGKALICTLLLAALAGCGGGGGGGTVTPPPTPGTAMPFLTVTTPSLDGTIVAAPTITVNGFSAVESTVTVNGSAVTVQSDGSFSLPGVAISTVANPTAITVISTTGTTVYTITRFVYYQDTTKCTLVYAKPDPRTGLARIFDIDPTITGSERMISPNAPGTVDSDPAVSPDRSTIVFVRTSGATQSVIKTPCTGAGALTTLATGAHFLSPAWSKSGAQVAYSSDAPGNYEIYTTSAAGGAATRITNHAARDDSPTWNSSDSAIVYSSNRNTNGDASIGARSNLWTVPLNNLAAPALLFDPTAGTSPACPAGQGNCNYFNPDMNASNQLVFQFETAGAAGGGQNPPGSALENIVYYTGPFTAITAGSNYYTRPRWNAAGDKIVFTSTSGGATTVMQATIPNGVLSGTVTSTGATNASSPDW